jgi:serine/threonine-protein kinase
LTNYQVERLMKGERSGFFFGRYRVLYLVGTGTFARVYRAVHQDTDQVVALKVLRNRFSESPVQSGQFLREGHVGVALRHPNIVPIYEVASDSKNHFMVMEFVEGRNLREFVKIRKKLSAVEATRMTTDIARGLDYAFQNGLTHRDLKMSNVLVSATGQAKLVDFGLAALDDNLSDELLDDMPNARTIDYAALERATGVRKDDTRSDIYFLGCIYYHMLTGVPPLPETTDRLQRLSKRRFQEIVPIRKMEPHIPDSVALVVNKAMTLDPMKRYQSPAEMLGDLAIASKRLQQGDEGTGEAGGAKAASAPPEPTHSVMVIESNPELQEVFRNSLKRLGYRVLLTSDPARAVARFRQDTTVADCVIINAQELGQPALESFNALGGDRRTLYVPALLLLDQSQEEWRNEAQTAERRMVLSMPISVKQLRETLARMLAPRAKK